MIKPLPLPTPDNAFKDGCLNLEVARALVKHHNRQKKVKLKGAPDGKVLEADDSTVFDLGPMFGGAEVFYIINDGELRRGAIPVRWL